MGPESVKRWSRRLVVSVLLILVFIVMAGGLVEMGILGDQGTEMLESVLDALDTYFETF